ncbi:hypothetical protein PROFUN_09480 [Planoprotostelium fungivorum]|uniref:Uncharacterized protein n=1 Tax=Planoprotostelium fungivorum TaxID=1890364 RepID=A0A2P6NH32_9EUKA|nr:hypothetical protein PROFUN_09480 [Planoprotostelium fungivorum]
MTMRYSNTHFPAIQFINTCMIIILRSILLYRLNRISSQTIGIRFPTGGHSNCLDHYQIGRHQQETWLTHRQSCTVPTCKITEGGLRADQLTLCTSLCSLRSSREVLPGRVGGFST